MESNYGDIYPQNPNIGYTEVYTPLDILPLHDGTFLEVRQYERHNITRNGACIMKYDKATHACLANVQFVSWPIYTHSQYYGYPIGLRQSANGNLYFAYRTNANYTTTKGWIGIVKLDTNLNILWQRYCLGSRSPSTGYLHTYCRMTLLDDGFAIGGRINKEKPPFDFFHYFVHDGDPTGIPEAEAFLRPYLFYPNPAQDQLHLHYSPDVQPKAIELYDLQGRLVHKQAKDLENVDLRGFAPGQYLMKVMLEDRKSYTDKLVKE